MSPNASELPSASGGSPPGGGSDGLTLVEMVIALVVASLVITASYRFLKDAYGSYNLQEQVAERDQNLNFVLNRFVELMQQAGAGLPDSGLNVIRREGNALVLAVNPRGAEHFQGSAAAASLFLGVGDAGPFRDPENPLQSATHVLIDYADPSRGISRVAIADGYGERGFVAGIKDNPDGLDSLRLASPVALSEGDRIYGYRELTFEVLDGNLVVRPDGSTGAALVLAENIDSLGFTFRDRNNRVTGSWRAMQTVSVTVRARTARPDLRLPAPGYRVSTASMNVNLRSRM